MTQKRKTSRNQVSLALGNDNVIRQALRERMLSLNYHAYCRLMALLLEKMGYEEVQLAGRTHWKGKHQNGGYDLTAFVHGALSRRRVLIQVKQFDANQRIFQNAVDSLRGTVLRIGASEALLITTGVFSPSVHRMRNALYESPIAPVRLMDGERLLDEMMSHRVGVVQGDTELAWEPSFYRIDDALFESLARYDGNSRLDCLSPGEPRFLVTVSVQPLKRAALKVVKSLTQ